jgi:hypothetical protein
MSGLNGHNRRYASTRDAIDIQRGVLNARGGGGKNKET